MPAEVASGGVRVILFSQEEDGIRDGHVTGVQTCALPIVRAMAHTLVRAGRRSYKVLTDASGLNCAQRPSGVDTPPRQAHRAQGSRWRARVSPGEAAA